jgi:importin subunit beta-1
LPALVRVLIYGTAAILLPHVATMLDLIQRALGDEERTDGVVRLSFGIIGDLAETFPSGQLKNLLSADWIAAELRSKARASSDTKKTARWAREVGAPVLLARHGCG